MADVKIEGFTLHTYAEGIDRELEAMFSKAMCSYANMKEVNNAPYLTSDYDRAEAKGRFEAEYEATIRCIGMFVHESLYAIQHMVVEAATKEFDL